MYEFECWHEDSHGEKWATQRYVAKTAAKAKVQHYHYLQDGLFEGDFFAVVKGMKCRKVGRASIRVFFGDYEQFERVKQARDIGFTHQGMRVSVCGQMGTIVGGNSSMNLDVVLDGQYHKSNCHPWYETVYFDRKGNAVADFRKKAAEA